MLHARIDVAQILGMFQVGAEITEFSAGNDPTVWVMRPILLELPDSADSGDVLTNIQTILALWSERTISKSS